jgi:membrane fusion protein (multidrug efflux system)
MRLLTALAAGLALAACGWWAWMEFVVGDTVSTDNAYTAVELFQITPQVAGPVKAVQVIETQLVNAGDVLVLLDATDTKIAVARAKAELSTTEQKVRQLFANDQTLAGTVQAAASAMKSADAELRRAKADLAKAELDMKRRKELIKTGAISIEELDNAETVMQKAQAAVARAAALSASARGEHDEALGARAANMALINGATVDTHPEVLAARAALEQAEVNLQRTVIHSPVAGVVSRRAVEVGQYVQPGARLMTIAPIQNIYVDANFKENQLRRVQVGQAVRLHSDIYGSDVEYTGRVVGFSGGSGSVFAAIPAQEATGNWIKVVQRLPVRIQLDPEQLEKHPLRVGLSMYVTVDLSSGPARTDKVALRGDSHGR